MNRYETQNLHWAWRTALAFFILAALTGSFYRFAIATGSFFGLELVNVRHAHSHAMYFGWVTPALMVLIAQRLPALGARRPPGIRPVIIATFVTAMVAYPPFLLYGYSPAVFGEARLPLSVISAGLNVLAWYAFVAVYGRARRDAPASTPLRFFDAALFFLVLATLGAWGLPVVQALGIESVALKTALTHVFLDVFSEGWFVLATLGLAASASSAASSEVHAQRALAGSGTSGVLDGGLGIAAVGIPFTFALGMPASLVPPIFRAAGGAGGLFVAIGLVVASWGLSRRPMPTLWRFAIVCLVLKAVAEGIAAVVPGARWAEIPQLRILYLHLMLLGFVTTGLVAAARDAWGRAAVRGSRIFLWTIAAVLLSLLPLTPLWPSALRGSWAFPVAALISLAPIVVAGAMCATSSSRSAHRSS